VVRGTAGLHRAQGRAVGGSARRVLSFLVKSGTRQKIFRNVK
jgi:hypothetical protein